MRTEPSTDPGLDLDQALTELSRLTSSEQHFDEMKSGCRVLASTWLLATFGAMGFSLTQTLHAALPTEVVTLALGVAGAIGIFLLWILDLLVYHRLLDASFTEALKLETAFPQVPQVRHGMVASQPGGQTPLYEEWFYIGGVVAPVAFSGALFIRWCSAMESAAGMVAAIVLLACLAGAVVFMRRMSPNPVVFKTLHS